MKKKEKNKIFFNNFQNFFNIKNNNKVKPLNKNNKNDKNINIKFYDNNYITINASDIMTNFNKNKNSKIMNYKINKINNNKNIKFKSNKYLDNYKYKNKNKLFNNNNNNINFNNNNNSLHSLDFSVNQDYENELNNDYFNYKNLNYCNNINNNNFNSNSNINLIIIDNDYINNSPLIPIDIPIHNNINNDNEKNFLGYDKSTLDKYEKILNKYETPYDKKIKNNNNNNNFNTIFDDQDNINNIPKPMKNENTEKFLTKDCQVININDIKNENKEKEKEIIYNESDEEHSTSINNINNNSNNSNNTGSIYNYFSSNNSININNNFESEENMNFTDDLNQSNINPLYITPSPPLMIKEIQIKNSLGIDYNLCLSSYNDLLQKLLKKKQLQNDNNNNNEIKNDIKKITEIKKKLQSIENFYSNEIDRYKYKLYNLFKANTKNDIDSRLSLQRIIEKIELMDKNFLLEEKDYINQIKILFNELESLTNNKIDNKLLNEFNSIINNDNINNNNNNNSNNNNINNINQDEDDLLSILSKFKLDENKYTFNVPSKYHMNNNVKCIKISIIKENIIKIYENRVFDLINKQKTIRRIFPDGYEYSLYKNNDIKQKFPNGNIFFYYDINKAYEFRFIRKNFTVFKFKSGQYEKHYHTGRIMCIKFIDGSYRIIGPKRELFQFSDGKIVIKNNVL